MRLPFTKKKERSVQEEVPAEFRSIENPNVPISNDAIIQILSGGEFNSIADIKVNEDNALSVPAIWCAVNFISSTIAGLPLDLYQRTENDEREKINNELSRLLHDAVNDETTSFDWRKYLLERTLLKGRGLTFIERNGAGRIINFWPLDPEKVTVKRKGQRKIYEYKEGRRETITYRARDIIDLTFMFGKNGVDAVNPIERHRDTIALSIAATKYGGNFFNNGGVPPFVVQGPFKSGQALERAAKDIQEAVKNANREKKNTITLPLGHEAKPLGVDPEKSQLVALKRFIVEEIARIFSIPPNFLQDLTKGTFSNTEQADIQVVKHTLKRWIEQIEQELNLKLFGRNNNNRYVEFNLDGILRGDFKTRIEGFARGIQAGIYKPSEARKKMNLPHDADGDKLMIQSGTVPISSITQEPAANDSADPEEDDENVDDQTQDDETEAQDDE